MTMLITAIGQAYSVGHMVKMTLFQMDILIVPRLGLGFLSLRAASESADDRRPG